MMRMIEFATTLDLAAGSFYMFYSIHSEIEIKLDPISATACHVNEIPTQFIQTRSCLPLSNSQFHHKLNVHACEKCNVY